ncbi:DEAD/DEAH box helicase [Cellulosimicrobium cellulans]|uniref:DEAD/DEAH box helicase n=1 Tax=Cellulosimicrobium cellulans TaxID=1710 RepID=UPI0037F5D0CB
MSLIGYQAEAVRQVVARINSGATAYQQFGERTAVSLSAPTGSGKTIVAAAVIEQLLFGSEGQAANDRLAVLWVSDSPALNLQTRDKFERYSSRFTSDRLVVIGDTDPVDVPALEPGKVYFVNTQKLGNGASSFRKVDGVRDFDLWTTIDGTGRVFGTDFLMVVDEAHKGTGVAASRGADTILGRLVKGGDLLTHPAPMVFGISATPERFEDLVRRDMSVRSVTVDVDLVRESGLVKDEVLLLHPSERQQSDATLLTRAAHTRQEMALAWNQYTESEGLSPVEPILLVQVPAGESDQRIGEILDILYDADPSLRDDLVVHALEDHRTNEFGSHSIRWIEPSRIQETAHIKVVLFKEALTTGWDCPRAEVIISLRSAQDVTYITQLIGRTVRTPLTQRIETVDALNSVWAFLPHFDETTVTEIVSRLRSGDDAIASGVTVNPVLLEPNPEVPTSVWEAFEGFPTNTKPSKTARNDVARAVSLGMLLNGHGVSGVGTAVVQRTVVSALASFMERDDVAEFVEEKVRDFESIDFTVLSVDWMTGEVVNRVESSMHVAAANVADLFNAAKRKLPEATAQWLWDHLCDSNFPDDPDRARLYVAAASFHPDAASAAESAARTLFRSWLREYRAVLIGDREAQARATELQAQSRLSDTTNMARPARSSVPRADKWWDKHLLSAKAGQTDGTDDDAMYEAGKFPWDANTWEAAALNAELARPGVVAWYRNPAGGTQSIGVPWVPDRSTPDAQRMMYPDIVVFRESTDGIEVDIVDPHRPDLIDAIPKWHALAEWAKQVNAGAFDVEATDATPARTYRLGRVWAIILDRDGEPLWVDLLDEPVRAEFARLYDGGLISESAVRGLFDALGARLEPTS